MFADKNKLMHTNSGDTVYLNTDEDFIRYIQDNLGSDFSDRLCFIRNVIPDIEDLYDDICQVCADMADDTATSPILHIKSIKRYEDFIKHCRKTLGKLVYFEE